MIRELDRAKVTQALGGEIAAIFLKHAEVLPSEEAKKLEPLVDVHIEAVHTIRTSMYPEVDVGLAVRLAEACKGLLRMYAGLDDRSRAAVVGAVRYFMQAKDASDDLSSRDGFLDDARVINYVIELTGADLPTVKIG